MEIEKIRHVAEIEIPEGYISIDCETEAGDINVVKLFPNQTSIDKNSSLIKNSTEFMQKLINNIEIELALESYDTVVLLNEFFREEFGKSADISITEVEYD